MLYRPKSSFRHVSWSYLIVGERQKKVLRRMTVSIADQALVNWSPHNLSSSHRSLQPLAFLLVLLLVVASVTVWRHGSQISRYLRCMVLKRNRHVRFAPLAEDSESISND